ncbi:helix-turn-helix domain-containing protein [Streptomyces halobius]|uniref:Helix-turn-helix domain-containing protein n=1 Tax=Streptomyces halobius TaxID=2879846 RepID=A0ABY4M2S1_9ACTN|nr:helix-turn-helix domain-containing protein [Streptomyces halobius]UQA92075.1 helix-turn-helix domain-containing protein [Streptomyces halobius]
MPVAPARPIAPTAAERERLKKMAYGHKTGHRPRMRAQVVVHAARGRSNARVARETGLHLDTVRTWRDRFDDQGIAGLTDRRRPGRPAAFTPLQRAQVTALACQLPAESSAPLSPWSAPEPAGRPSCAASAAFVSASTVRRWLKADAQTVSRARPHTTHGAIPTGKATPGGLFTGLYQPFCRRRGQ